MYALLTNGMVFMQAFKMQRQKELSLVSKLANAICQPTTSFTSQMRRPAQIIAVYTH